MRTLNLYYLIAVLFGLTPAWGQGQAQDGILVGEVVEQLEKNDGLHVVGYEFLAGSRDKMTDEKAVMAAIQQRDFDKLRKMIAAETDYECLTGKDYVVMVPKDGATADDVALAKRVVVFPAVTKVPVYDFLAQVQSADEPNLKVHLGGPLIFQSQAGGPVSTEKGESRCYLLLNALTMKLKARSWCIEHMVATNLITGKPFSRAITLRGGSVSIYARPSLGWVGARR